MLSTAEKILSIAKMLRLFVPNSVILCLIMEISFFAHKEFNRYPPPAICDVWYHITS